MAFSQWQVADSDPNKIEALVEALGVSRLAAVTLAARGFDSPQAAGQFIKTDVPLGDPFDMRDMDKAAERIRAAIDAEEIIAVFGDYDVDGVTATALMVQYLMGCGAHAICALPARDSAGYGLSKQAIDNLKKHGASLIITVDNGVSSFQEVAYAAELGVDIVVCDHHLPPRQLPEAVAVVDPLRADDTSAFKELAGVGVALKLAAAVEGCGVEEIMALYGYLAAIGTVSDIMPLTGENRVIVAAGLEQLRSCDSVGITALCEVCGIDPASLDTGKISFALAPRLNAAGRMGSADLALRLLLSDDVEEATEIAVQLAELNSERRSAEDEVAKKIAAILAVDREALKKPVVILAAQDLHSGVTGIVCSRLVERLGKPVVIISIEGDEGKGSGRSVAGFSLHEAIAAGSDVLMKYGGHEMAAGFTLKTADIESFRERVYAYCARQQASVPAPRMPVDAELRFVDINEDEVAGLSVLEPFGCGNETPVFCGRDLEVVDAVPLGEKHSRVTLGQGRRQLTGAVFGKPPAALPFKKGDRVDAAFVLSIYTTATRDMVSVRFKDIRRAGLGDDAYDSVAAYDEMTAGRTLCDRQLALLAPTRDDIAAVYRAVQSGGVDRFDYGALSFAFPAMPPGRAAAILDILEELSLAVSAGGFHSGVRPTPNPKKRELRESSLFRFLHKEETA